MNSNDRMRFLASTNDVYLYAFDDTDACMLTADHLTRIGLVIHECITTRYYDDGGTNFAEVLRRGVIFLAYARMAIRDEGV